MKSRDIVSSIFWIIIGLFFCIGAIKYSLYGSKMPGPGLFPFCAGVIIISLGTAVLFSAIREKPEKSQKQDFFPERDSWKRVGIAVLSLFVYVSIWGYIGFLLTTFLFLVVLLRFIEPQKWSFVLLVAVPVAVSFYICFQLLLMLHLPGGIFGL